MKHIAHRTVLGMPLFFCLLVCGMVWTQTGAAADNAAAPTVAGLWLTEPRNGIIEISMDARGMLEGRIVGGNEPGKLDRQNPDPARRNVVLRGQVILRDLKPDGERSWSGGTIYDPDSGSTYRCKLELKADGTLKVRGYLGISLLGKTQIWTRYTGTSMDLPKAP